MRKIWLQVFVALIAVGLMAGTSFASPEGEIWRYKLETRQGVGYIIYAYSDGDTFLAQCENNQEPTECQYYKLPCALYTDGFVCSFYLDLLGYAFGMQCINGTCGMMHSFFPLKRAIELTTLFYVVPFFPFIFQLEMVGLLSDVPDGNINYTIPDGLNIFEPDSEITI